MILLKRELRYGPQVRILRDGLFDARALYLPGVNAPTALQVSRERAPKTLKGGECRYSQPAALGFQCHDNPNLVAAALQEMIDNGWGPTLVSYGQRVYTQKWMAESKKLVFDWDGANAAHIARHGVTPSEAEEVVSGASVPLETEDRAGEERHAELGATAKGRLPIVAWTWRRRKIRVVTAFPAN